MSLVIRKIKTVIRNPKGVFLKYTKGKSRTSAVKVKKVNTEININKSPEVKKNKVSEVLKLGALSSPRVSYVLHDLDGSIGIQHVEKKIKNPSFTSLVFIENKKYVSDCDVADGINKATKYISFREHNLFFSDVIIDGNHNISDVFRTQSWRSNPFDKIKNAIFINPSANYFEAVAYSKPNLQSIAVFTSKLQVDNLDVFDKVVVSKSLDDLQHRNLTYFDNIDDIPKIIGDYINLTSKRAFDLLVPIYGSVGYLDDIDELNTSGVDMIFWLKEKPKVEMCTFEDLSYRVAKNTSAILVKESVLYKYKTLVDNNNIKDLFKLAASDGLKIEVKYDSAFK